MVSHRFLADPEPPRDLLVGQPAGHLLHDGQLVRGHARGTAHLAPGPGRQVKDPLEVLLERHVLVDESLCAAGERLAYGRLVHEGAHRKHLDGRKRAAQAPGHFETRQLRHLHVHEDDVWLAREPLVKRFLPVTRLPDHLHSRIGGKHPGETGAEERLVVGDEHLDRLGVVSHSSRHAGTRTSTLVPPVSRSSAANVPPRIAARSTIPCIPKPCGASAMPAPSSRTTTTASFPGPTSRTTSIFRACP